eukprot:360572-Chlamydomonas_euryale.AAC.2
MQLLLLGWQPATYVCALVCTHACTAGLVGVAASPVSSRRTVQPFPACSCARITRKSDDRFEAAVSSLSHQGARDGHPANVELAHDRRAVRKPFKYVCVRAYLPFSLPANPFKSAEPTADESPGQRFTK